MKTSLLMALTLSSALFAQNPLSTAMKAQYMLTRGALVRAAEKMPEDNYDFKPVPEVRSFGQLVGHVANASYFFCSTAMGEKSPSTVNVEKTVTKKAALVESLKAAMAYCDKAYDGMTDAKATTTVKLMGNEAPAIAALTFNTAHDNEHYGNIVTYMRLKGLVPPSSEPK